MAVKWWRQLALHCIIMAISNACPLCNTIKNMQLSVSIWCCQRTWLEVKCHEQNLLASLSYIPDRVTLSEGKTQAHKRSTVCSDKQRPVTGKTSSSVPVAILALSIIPCFQNISHGDACSVHIHLFWAVTETVSFVSTKTVFKFYLFLDLPNSPKGVFTLSW
jgi:hypothetical protein